MGNPFRLVPHSRALFVGTCTHAKGVIHDSLYRPGGFRFFTSSNNTEKTVLYNIHIGPLEDRCQWCSDKVSLMISDDSKTKSRRSMMTSSIRQMDWLD